jgi:tetratricopeptide (TPR) repeat protein
MGAVYEAWDKELGVAVALKVIRPETAGDPQSTFELERRFKRELLLARQVTHRNVVRIHDLGEIDGIRYITMALVEGTDLRSRLRVDVKLAVPQALAIARQIAAGLQAAHEAGIVHRDLKPANVMLGPEGRALIMDFGLARYSGPIAGPRSASAITGEAPTAPPAAQRAGADATTPALLAPTSIQGLVGTLEYMAPEQARGGPIDARADIFAFGVILQEMLLGLRPTGGDISRVEAMWLRISQPPASLRDVDPGIPPSVDAIVVRCQQFDPANRYQTMTELSAALDALDADGKPRPKSRRLNPLGVAAAVVAVAAVAAGGTWWLTRPTVATPRPKMQLLMASFTNSTSEAGLETTIEQALSLSLEGASFITTFPRRDALRLAKEQFSSGGLDESTARLIAVREGVDAVIGGTVEARGGGYRLQVHALDPQGQPMARQVADAKGKADLLDAVTRVASRLRDDFGDTTPASVRQKDIETFTTASLEAVKEYARAQELASLVNNEEAIRHYQAALTHDATFGRAYSGWAVAAYNLGRTGEAGEAYVKALALLDRMTEREKLRTLGAYYLQITGSYDKAIENYSELVARYPFDPAGHSNLAIAYFGNLDFRRAMEEGRAAIQLNPRDVRHQTNFALFAMYAGEFETAVAEARKVIAANPASHNAYLTIAIAAMQAGDLDLARTTYGQMAEAGPIGASLSAHGLGDLAMFSGLDTDAAGPLRQGIAEDEKARRTVRALAKQIALAEAMANLGQRADAKALALAIVKNSGADSARVPAARVLARAGEAAEAARIADELAAGRQPQTRAYGRILQAEQALARRDSTQAIQLLGDARKSADLWLGRFLLGVSLVEAGAYAEAVSELELAWKRRGEATALFLDDRPTLRYLPPLRYWLGRAHEGLNAPTVARAHYEGFLALRPAASKDPLAADARKRLALLSR